MPVNNDYNRMIADEYNLINQRYIASLGDETFSASHIMGNASKKLEGGAILGMNPNYRFGPPPENTEVSKLTCAIQPPSGMVHNAGTRQPYRDLGSMKEPVSSLMIGGYNISADTELMEEGDVVEDDDGNIYEKKAVKNKLTGGIFFIFAIIAKAAIAAAKAAAAAAKALAIKAAALAAKLAAKKAAKAAAKKLIKKNVKKQIKKRIKKQVKKEVKDQIKEQVGNTLEQRQQRVKDLKTGNEDVDEQGFDLIVERSNRLDELRADPDTKPERINKAKEALQRAEEIAHYKGYKQYIKQNRLGKDANFTQEYVDNLRNKIEGKLEKEHNYEIAKAEREVQEAKQEIRDTKADATKAFQEAKKTKINTKNTIASKDKSIAELKANFERMLAEKKKIRDDAKARIDDEKERYKETKEAARQARIDYIEQIGTAEQRKQLEAELKEEERLRKEAEAKAEKIRAEEERKAEIARKEAERLAEIARIEKERLEAEARKAAELQANYDAKEAERLRLEAVAKAERYGNKNFASAYNGERRPTRTRGSYFSK